MKNTIISALLDKRSEDAPDVQEIFTRHGCVINVRLGVHELKGCSDNGLILLVTSGDDAQIDDLISDLEAHPRLKINTMDVLQ